MTIDYSFPGWLIAILGVTALFVVIRWLFQPSRNDSYNQALIHHKRLRYVIDRPDEYQTEALKVIQLCQIALQQNPNHGDAHVVLATAYFMLANRFLNTATYNYCMPQAVAVILNWDEEMMYTKSRRNGNKAFQLIHKELELIASIDPPLVKTFIKDQRTWYPIAIDPGQFEKLKLLAEYEFLLSNALELFEQGDTLQAIEQYTQLIQRDPKNARAFYGRGMAFNSIANYKAALIDMEEAINLAPDSFYFAGRALVHAQMGDYETAFSEFSRVIKLSPSFVEAYMHRGVALLKLGRIEEARSDFFYYLAHTPNNKSNEEKINMVKMLLLMNMFEESLLHQVKLQTSK